MPLHIEKMIGEPFRFFLNFVKKIPGIFCPVSGFALNCKVFSIFENPSFSYPQNDVFFDGPTSLRWVSDIRIWFFFAKIRFSKTLIFEIFALPEKWRHLIFSQICNVMNCNMYSCCNLNMPIYVATISFFVKKL